MEVRILPLQQMTMEKIPNLIMKYKDKKLVEYLKPGLKVMIRFGHGLGDTLLFIPVYEKLKRLYPDVHFDLYVEAGQEQIFKSVKNKDDPSYDYIFHLDFPMSEGVKTSKPAKCCRDEIGIDPITEVTRLGKYPSPLVGVHFHGTALPGSVGCPENIAQQIWKEVKEAGKIPIEAHFQHMWHNPVNIKFPFVESTVRESQANLKNLIGLVQKCSAFIGVASGPFIVALSAMPKRTLFLERSHKLECYTLDKEVQRVDVQNYKPGSVKQWLLNLP